MGNLFSEATKPHYKHIYWEFILVWTLQPSHAPELVQKGPQRSQWVGRGSTTGTTFTALIPSLATVQQVLGDTGPWWEPRDPPLPVPRVSQRSREPRALSKLRLAGSGQEVMWSVLSCCPRCAEP